MPESAEFDAAPHDTVADLVGDVVQADLRALLAGNQFMAVPELVDRFCATQQPSPRVFYETLPPGVLIGQLRRGALRMGSLLLRFVPDVFAAGPELLHQLHEEGVVGRPRTYASNVLSLLVRSGNPAAVHGWADLARPDIRVALPNPETEGIGRKALDAIKAAGGEHLHTAILDRSRRSHLVRTTSIHHRQGVSWLRDGRVDVAVVWDTEARHHCATGAPVEKIALPPEQNVVGRYAVATVAGAPHPEEAEAFVRFLTAQAGPVLEKYGFMPAG